MAKGMLEKDKCKKLLDEVAYLQLINKLPKDILLVNLTNEQRHTANKHLDFGWNAMLNALGRIPGAADYMIWYGGARFVWLEMKRDKSSRQSPAQKAFETMSIEMNTPYLCTYEIDKALLYIAEHHPRSQELQIDITIYALGLAEIVSPPKSRSPRVPRLPSVRDVRMSR